MTILAIARHHPTYRVIYSTDWLIYPTYWVTYSLIKDSEQCSKKRGRPTKSDSRSQIVEEIQELIELVSRQKNPFDTKHKDYFNREVCQKNTWSYTGVITRKKYSGYCKTNTREIGQLKNYYGGQKRLIENFKKVR